MMKECVSWINFEVHNSNKEKAFEDLCRCLFQETVLKDVEVFLHSNSNNPGVEVEPVKNSKGMWVSFQAKYFSSKVNYQQIEDSLEKAIEYYQGKLDVIYLYCNKDVNTTSQSYKRIVDKLDAIGMQLQLVTNSAILDEVRKNPRILLSFFHDHEITNEWYCKQVAKSLKSLGEKYNSQFNTNTDINHYIDLFLHEENAIHWINQKKTILLQEVKKLCGSLSSIQECLSPLIQFVNRLPDIERNTIRTALKWYSSVCEEVKPCFTQLSNELKEAKEQLVHLDKRSGDARFVQHKINVLEQAVYLPNLLKFTDIEYNLVNGKVLLLKGEAGVGKSQALAYHASTRINEGKATILLLGSEFLHDNDILEEIPRRLGWESNFKTLLAALGRTALKENTNVAFLIDAINEAQEKAVWRRDLPQLVEEVNKYKQIKVIISMRSGYEQILIGCLTKKLIDEGQIIEVLHEGFRTNTFQCIDNFLTHAGVRFSPFDFFRSEMANPLFLMLLHKVYDGSNFDLFELFYKVVQKKDEESQKVIGLGGEEKILPYLIDEIMDNFHVLGKRMVPQDVFLDFRFWNKFGIYDKLKYLSSLCKSGFLTKITTGENEYYDITYDLIRDFLYAKHLMKMFPTQERLRTYLANELLRIENNEITKCENCNLFSIIAALYAEQYRSECIDIVEMTNDNLVKENFLKSYFNSFLWRKNVTIDLRHFCEFATRTHRFVADVYDILIGNSTRFNHPLNVEFLHEHLMKQGLAERDAKWTIYINELFYPENRVYQVIEYFESTDVINLKQEEVQLLLTLFTWFLTASNRKLRDRTSHAMVNILKENIENCLWLLKKFEAVNDPYLKERLYGIVFGACVKRINEEKEEFRKLVEYVYHTIFDTNSVCPDIFLRDYTRLIVERWRYEYPCECEWIEKGKLTTPYKSAPIPTVRAREYYKNGEYGGVFRIAMAMWEDGGCSWSACNSFYQAVKKFINLDIENLYHAMMQYILDELGYKEELFATYDARRHPGMIERVGEKYQWITVAHMLARIADNYMLRSDYNEPLHYLEGLWEIDFRLFDPTFNEKMINSKGVPTLKMDDYNIDWGEDIDQWLKSECSFFNCSDLIVTDSMGDKWILLHQFVRCMDSLENINKIQGDYGRQGSRECWKLCKGYFVSKQEFDALRIATQDIDFMREFFPENGGLYNLFNREIPWSSACKKLRKGQWMAYTIATGEKAYIQTQCPLIVSNDLREDGKIEFKLNVKECEYERCITKQVASVMPATISMMFELGGDFSRVAPHNFRIPCVKVLEDLKLQQQKHEGLFFDEEGTLVAFDVSELGLCNGMVIRLEHLEWFLKQNNLVLFWTCKGEKEYFFNSYGIKRSVWSTFAYLNFGEVIGKLQFKGGNIEEESGFGV